MQVNLVHSEIEEILHLAFGDVKALVYVNVNDNSDFGCETTYRVEIGLADHPDTFGLFGSSSPFASTLEAAYIEATYDFLYRCHLRQQKDPLPAVVAWHRRLQ